jgi:hypothetical protein
LVVSTSAAPHGFRENALGLLVPEEVSRERHVMSWQEWRDLEKVTKALEARGIVLQMKCADPRCQRTPIVRHRTLEGGISFRCAHRDLVYTKAIK